MIVAAIDRQDGARFFIRGGNDEFAWALDAIACRQQARRQHEIERPRRDRAVATGGKHVSAELAQSMVQEMLDNPDGRPPHATLSEREFQIFCKLAQDVGVSEIAEELSLSVKSISTYRSRVLDKMSMRSNADITAYAIKNQLIP